MERPTYEEVGKEFDRLFKSIMESFDWKNLDLYETNRLKFRSEWLSYLESVGWTEDEWETKIFDLHKI